MTINADIDRIFKDGLQEYSPKVPAYIWDHIEQNLDHRKNKNRRTLIYSIAASVAILIAFGTGFLMTENQTNGTANKNSIAVVDSSLNKEQTEQEQTLPLADDKDQKKVEGAKSDEKNTTVKENSDKKQEHKIKSNSIKAHSSGTLLPPMFGKKMEISVLDSNRVDTGKQPMDTLYLKK
jgi:hypothetical protein